MLTRTLAALAIGLMVAATMPVLTGAQETPGAPPAPPPPPQEPRPQASTERPEPAVELLEAGADDRRELRYAPAVGSTQRCVVSMQMTVAQSLGGMARPPQRMPETRLTLEMTVDAVGDDGAAQMRGVFTGVEVVPEPDIQPALIGVLRQMYADLEGRSIELTATSRGIVRSVRLVGIERLHPAAADQLRTVEGQLAQSIIILPAQAVGTGGKWRVDGGPRTQGLESTQSRVIELVRMSGGEVVLSMTMEQRAGEQDMNAPGMPPGSVRLKSMHTEGRGDVTVALDRLLPVSLATVATSTSENEIAIQGAKQTTTQRMDIRFSITEAKDAAAAEADPEG
jgi:hypothetical protein